MARSRSRLAADWFAKLRINETTQEVEHPDVVAVETSVTTTIEPEITALANNTYTKTEVDAAIAGATMAAGDILTSIKTVDGSGSGLDADTVDGVQAGDFLQFDDLIAPLTTGSSSVYDTGNVTHNTTGEVIYRTWTSQSSGTATFTFVNIENSNGYGYTRVRQNGNQIYYNQTTTSNTTTINVAVNAGDTFTMSGWGSYAGNGTSRTNIQTNGAMSILPQFK